MTSVETPLTHAPLTQATDDWVSEARQPATPYRTAGWLRYAVAQASAEPDPLGLGGPMPAPTAPEHHEAPANVPDFLRYMPVASPAPAEASAPPAAGPPPSAPSRMRRVGPQRPGLGAPLSHPPGPPASVADVAPHVADDLDDGDEGDDGGATPAELVHPPAPPAPAPAAPVLPRYRPAPGASPRPLPPLPQFVDIEQIEPPVEPVPHDVVSSFQSTHGFNVSDVPVRRGPEVSAEARTLRARAFARRGEVFLPREAGALDSREARGLLAHELTHVVQQRTLGVVPEPESHHGRWLEHEATVAERSFRGDAGAPAPAPLAHPPKPTITSRQVADLIEPGIYAERVADELVSRGIAHRSSEGVLEFGPPPSSELVGAGAAQLAVDVDTSEPTGSRMFETWSATNDERSATGFEPLGPGSFPGDSGPVVERMNAHYENLIERENEIREHGRPAGARPRRRHRRHHALPAVAGRRGPVRRRDGDAPGRAGR